MFRVIPLSVRLAAFHEDLRDWHREMARNYGEHGHERAGQDHLEAAAVHEAAMAEPFNDPLAGAARRASGLADEASQRWACGRSCPGRSGKAAGGGVLDGTARRGPGLTARASCGA